MSREYYNFDSGRLYHDYYDSGASTRVFFQEYDRWYKSLICLGQRKDQKLGVNKLWLIEVKEGEVVLDENNESGLVITYSGDIFDAIK